MFYFLFGVGRYIPGGSKFIPVYQIYALQTDPIGIVKVEFGIEKVREMTMFAQSLID